MHSSSERIPRLKKSRDDIARTENVCVVDDSYREAISEYADRPESHDSE